MSTNTFNSGEEQIDKQAEYHPYVVDISYIQLHFMQIQTVSDLKGFKAKSIIK